MLNTDVSLEIRRRIRVALAAYGYEIEKITIMSDSDYDFLALQINPQLKTGNETLDNFFLEHFVPYTGSWVHQHPELDKLANLYNQLYRV